MILKEFVENFVCINSLIRLWYPIKGGNEMVISGDKSVCMEHQLIRCEGIYKKYVNHNVIGVTDIVFRGPYPEAINIVIERIELDELREKQFNELGI